jgi:hypothetical protein
MRCLAALCLLLVLVLQVFAGTAAHDMNGKAVADDAMAGKHADTEALLAPGQW